MEDGLRAAVAGTEQGPARRGRGGAWRGVPWGRWAPGRAWHSPVEWSLLDVNMHSFQETSYGDEDKVLDPWIGRGTMDTLKKCGRVVCPRICAFFCRDERGMKYIPNGLVPPHLQSVPSHCPRTMDMARPPWPLGTRSLGHKALKCFHLCLAICPLISTEELCARHCIHFLIVFLKQPGF